MTVRRAGSGPVKPKPAGSTTRIGLHQQDVIGQLRLMRVAIAVAATQPVFLVREEDDANGPPGLQTELLHHPGLPGRDAAAAVVARARADVPRIEVPSDQHDLLRQLSAAQLADDVGRLAVRLGRFHREPDPNGDTAILETLKPVGVFGGDGRGGNLGEPGFAGGGPRRVRRTSPAARPIGAWPPPRLAAWDGPVER